MQKVIQSALTKFCWHSGLLFGLQRAANEVQLCHGVRSQLAFPYISRRRLPNFQILTYHRLTAKPDPFFPGIPVEVFARHVGFLAKRYSLMNRVELIRRMDDGKDIPKNAVALTFDDGYHDNYHLAFPLPQLYQVPAT